MNIETKIKLNKFKPRDYQKVIFDAIENEDYNRVMAIWPRRCLSGESHITMADGSWKFLKDLSVGDKIISWDGIKFVPDIVKNIWKTGLKETKTVKSCGFLPVVTSIDHQFATYNHARDIVQWKTVPEFNRGDQLLQYAGLPLGRLNEYDPDLAEFIGKMMCDKSHVRLLSNVWSFDDASLGRFFAVVLSYIGSLYMHKPRMFKDKCIKATAELTINCGGDYNFAWDMYWLLRKFRIIVQVPYKERNSIWKLKISDSLSVKYLLSYGPIIGKEEKQRQLLKALSTAVQRVGTYRTCCYRMKPNVTDSSPEELYDLETTYHHNFVANGYVVHNSGKDLTAYNICIRRMIRSVQTIYYIFPTFSSGRRILWDAINNDGFRILDYLPHELIESRNEQLMRIRLTNGSVFQIIGSDNFDQTLVGTNPRFVVFSEFALSNPMAYSFVRPILTANNGGLLIITTPRGKNFLYEMYQGALNSPDWHVSKLTVDDTCHIPIEEIEKERANGEMSLELQMQEYWTSFELGVEGSYYCKIMDRIRVNGQIGDIPWDPSKKVHTSWDIGCNDMTSIIFFQIANNVIRIIDCYEKNKEGIEHYVSVLKNKPYIYGSHIGPHDIRNMDFSTGYTRWEKARQLGITFKVADRLSIVDGIEAVRTCLPRCWIDSKNCVALIKALENYRQEYDAKKKVYKMNPLHDIFSNFADSMRYLAISLHKLENGLSSEQIEKNYREARYGSNTLTGFFGDTHERF